MTITTRLADIAWWRAALWRALYTAVTIAVPYFGGSLLAEIPWAALALAAGFGFVSSMVTSLAGLPEAVGTDLPWWLAAVERVVKTFFQALGGGLTGAVLLTDVDWAFVLQSALIAAGLSLLRLVLATLPQDPTKGTPPTRTVNQTIVLPDSANPTEVAELVASITADSTRSPR
ncbi:holin [Microbacterium stercoris]|uniref:Uncharacterized protein n=1 Tax=Microbacterium stercoris TaxID=2820289 RepID=A0A939TR41_9MICO|nr:holin [Microbacterium stercoris]MBO3663751.1 hypothetical protein [Microbacterium stercoris]